FVPRSSPFVAPSLSRVRPGVPRVRRTDSRQSRGRLAARVLPPLHGKPPLLNDLTHIPPGNRVPTAGRPQRATYPSDRSPATDFRDRRTLGEPNCLLVTITSRASRISV